MKILQVLVLVLAAPALLVSCATIKGETNFGYYSEAENYYAKGKFEKAISKYEAYLAEEPQGNMAIIAHYYIAKSQAALGHTEAAKAGYQAIIKDYPKSDWANFSKDQLELLEKRK